MTGIVGGARTGQYLRDAVGELSDDTATNTWHHESADTGIGMKYAETDPNGKRTWADGKRGGVVYGAITNLDELGWSVDKLFHRLFRQPHSTAEMVEGSFIIACTNTAEDRHLLVTDKLGTRSIYYTDDGPFHYASEVKTLLPVIDDPTVNMEGVCDMLLKGTMWGDNTLVEGVRALYPATVLEVVDEERTLRRYWKPDYTERDSSKSYIDELVRRYRQAARRVSSTLPSEAGLWLSGGLDSRTTASALLEHRSDGGFEDLIAYTYNANPPTNDNPKLAGKISQKLAIELRQVPLTAELVAEHFDRLIEATDGMVRWNSSALIGATYGTTPAPVMMEGMQGELVGDHPYRHHLSEFSSAVEAQVSSEASTPPEKVTRLLTESVDPLATFKREANRSPESTVHGTVMDIHFQNYYSRHTLANNRIMRERGGSRVAHADGDYLEWCAQLPRRYRKGAFPFANSTDGGIPYGTSRAKLALIRSIGPKVADVPYERTKVKPSWPYPAHVAGFVGNVAINRLLSKPTYGNGSLADLWIRNSETQLHKRVQSLVDDACSRNIFDADAVRDVYKGHMDGENNASLLGEITTLEYWIGTHLD
jgi:asparagine synthase (glutamine-hydrolysing)